MNRIATAGIKALATGLIRVLARIERGATVISGTIDARPGPFTSSMTGTVTQNLSGTASGYTSATGVLTQTPGPITHRIVLAAEVAVSADVATVVTRHVPTVLESIGGVGGIALGRIFALFDALLFLLLTHYYHWIGHTAAWMIALIKSVEQWIASH